MGKNILLITPDFNPADTTERSISSRLGQTFMATKAYMAPLGLATVAALTPDDVAVDIWDEAVHGIVTDATRFEREYDLVGVTGYAVHIGRVSELGRIFKRRYIPVVVGGPGVSAEPELYRERFDILFIGEAEYTWPQFISDWKCGSYRREYRQIGKVDMASSPLPRWHRIADHAKSYLMAGIQTTRGCPFDCEFCDVIYLYGRQARHKSVDQVLEEVRAIERLGFDFVLLCDDNFIGNPHYAKELLNALKILNASFRRALGFYTQLTLNVAKDDEMLGLLADANFVGVFTGIESPNIESLIEANKPQNYRTDILADVKKIHGYGLIVQAGMIVGFDHDDATVFDRQLHFLQQSGIANPVLNTLKAPTGTKLWVRLHKEGRIVSLRTDTSGASPHAGSRRRIEGLNDTAADIGHATNIVPKLMSRAELMVGYGRLVQQVRDWRNFERRIQRMISQVRRRPAIRQRRRSLKLLLRAVQFILFSMDSSARRATLRLVIYTLWRAPFMLERVFVQIWRQHVEAGHVPILLKEIDDHIRLEAVEGLERSPLAFFVPDGFRKAYRAIFPDLYRRVWQGVTDKSGAHDVLVEATCDFLTRWGQTFDGFEGHQRAFLNESCDRVIAAQNRRSERNGDPGAGAESRLENISNVTDRHMATKLKWLADDVLRTVEQQLREFSPQSSRS